MVRRLLAISIAVPALVMAQQNPATPESAAISGRVLNAKTGEPLRRVTLTLRPSAPPSRGTSFSMPQAAPYSTTTDAEGKFRIDKIEPGTYRLSAERQGFLRQEYGPANTTGMMLGTPLHIAAGQELKDLEIKMIPHGVVTGRVLDEEGEPLARVQIQAMRRRFMQGRYQLLPMGGAMTNDIGEYRMPDLPPGRYWVSAIYQGQMRSIMEGPARNPDGTPEEDYVMTFYPGSIDEAGARAVELQAGQQLPGIDIRMQKAAVYRVRGKVSGIDSVRNVRVLLMPRQSGIAERFMLMRTGAMVKDDGSFEIGGVRPGSYFLTIMPMGPNTASAVGKTPVDVTSDNVEGVILALSPPMALSGRIHLPKDSQVPEPLSGIRIQMSPVEGLPMNVPSAAVKEDGAFTVQNLAPDKYRIEVFGLPKGTWLKSISAGGQDVLESGLDLSGGAAIPVEIALGVGAATVTGVVQDSNQQPALGALVVVVPDPLKPGRNDLQKTAPVDQRGQFSISGIAPGHYRVYAWTSPDVSELLDPEILKSHEGKAKRLTLQENGQENLTLTPIVPDTASPQR